MKVIISLCFVLISLNVLAKRDTTFTKQEKEVVANEVSCIPDSTIQKFETIFKSWKESWRTNPLTRFSSNTKDLRKLKEYEELINMGQIIIPLTIKKMMNQVEGDFIGLLLYETLQSDKSLVVKESFMSEQDKAIKMVKLWTKSKK